MIAAVRAIRHALRGIGRDQDLLAHLGGERYRRRALPIAAYADPGLRAAFLMRLISAGAPRWLQVTARNRLLRSFASDISPEAQIRGSIYLPHPTGIVIGAGTILGDRAKIYQGVTIGAGKSGGYPTLESDVTIFPNAVIVGGIVVGKSAKLGANSVVNYDVPAGTTIRADENR